VESLKKLVAENIRSLRKAKGWSQSDLAEASGVSFGGLQGIEQGKANPRPSTIEAIAGALGVSEKSLYSGAIETVFTSPEGQSKSDLIAAIVALIPALNEFELKSVLNSIEAAPSITPPAKPVAGARKF